MNSRAVFDCLRKYESRNITFRDPEGHWPVVWERARGCHVWDAEGRKYLDLTAAFGVAAAGHANPRVVAAGQRQMGRMLHAMGDVHPHALKAQLARELSRITFERWRTRSSPASGARERALALRGRSPALPRSESRSNARHGKAVFANSGFEAVEVALKTAQLATGKPGIIAFEGAYHGLGYGTLNATHRAFFREPFRNQLREFGHFAAWPCSASAALSSPGRGSSLSAVEADLQHKFKTHAIGAILVEPIQVRGGVRIPDPEFLPLLRRLATEHDALLILDEIYTGFGRTGRWFACEHSGVVPDIICLGKALTGGFPLSACVGRADVMDSWPTTQGEAIHTSTFLGHPVGCAMALAQIAELRRRRLPERSARLGQAFLNDLWQRFPSSRDNVRLNIRGLGLLVGIEFTQASGTVASEFSLSLVKRLLERRFLVLPEGEHAEVVSFTPPLTISAAELGRAAATVCEELTSTFAPSSMRRSQRSLNLRR